MDRDQVDRDQVDRWVSGVDDLLDGGQGDLSVSKDAMRWSADPPPPSRPKLASGRLDISLRTDAAAAATAMRLLDEALGQVRDVLAASGSQFARLLQQARAQSSRETATDECLHLAIANALLTFRDVTLQVAPATLEQMMARYRAPGAVERPPWSPPAAFGGVPVLVCEDWAPGSWAVVDSAGQVIDCGGVLRHLTGHEPGVSRSVPGRIPGEGER